MMRPGTLDLLHGGEEVVYPITFNRSGTSAPSVLQRAHDEVERILANWTCPVSEKICADIEKLLR